MIANESYEIMAQFKYLIATVRRLYNEELHNLYPSPNIIRVIKSRRMRWAGHIARMRDIRNAYNIVVGKLEGKSHLEDLDVDERIMLKRILSK
jgi:hypothetical protein